MNKALLLASIVLLASCNSERDSTVDNRSSVDNAASDARTSRARASAESMSLLGTTWEFSDRGAPTVITIDQAGNYVEQRTDGTPVVHGTYAQIDGKDCFTSATGDGSTSCWTAVPQTGIGETASATSDAGNSAVFKRVDYRALKVPG